MNIAQKTPQKQILDLLTTEGKLVTAEIAAKLEINPKDALDTLNRMYHKGMIGKLEVYNMDTRRSTNQWEVKPQ